MSRLILEEVSRIEGFLQLRATSDDNEAYFYIKSGRSLHHEGRMFGKNPLEAMIHSQRISASSGLSHGICAAMALENYLQLEPTPHGHMLRKAMHQLSCLSSHLNHFYLEVVPDYLNANHFERGDRDRQFFLPTLQPRNPAEGDLSPEAGRRMISRLPALALAQANLQKALTLLGGRYPILPSLMPGGLTQAKIKKDKVMEVIRLLDQIKPLVEEAWPRDLTTLIQSAPALTQPQNTSYSMISMGNSSVDTSTTQPGDYAAGVYIDGRLEPVDTEKITEDLTYTYYKEKKGQLDSLQFDFDKVHARTWIKAARYEEQPMQTGALARMLVTHYGGGNSAISDTVQEMLKNLGLDLANANSAAARLSAEMYEGRFFLISALTSLMELDYSASLLNQTSFDFSDRGVGIGTFEAPAGSIMHQIEIEGNQIMSYRIISPQNWNLAPLDKAGRSGIVESEMNRFLGQRQDSLSATRLLHSYYAQALDGVQ